MRLDSVRLAQAHSWIGCYERFWTAKLDALEALLRAEDEAAGGIASIEDKEDIMITSPPIPHLVVDGAERAIGFYEQAFGAKCEGKHPAEDGKRLMHAHLTIGAGALFLHDDFPEFGDAGGVKAPGRLGGASLTVHLETDDADAAWERAVKAGAEVVMPLDNQFWGQRYGKLRDPFGHVWSIGGPVKE